MKSQWSPIFFKRNFEPSECWAPKESNFQWPYCQIPSHQVPMPLVQEKAADGYELPSAIEAAASILMHYLKTDERLYGQDPWTVTRCQEIVAENQWPVAIGDFSPGGLSVYGGHWDSSGSGVAAVRKF